LASETASTMPYTNELPAELPPAAAATTTADDGVSIWRSPELRSTMAFVCVPVMIFLVATFLDVDVPAPIVYGIGAVMARRGDRLGERMRAAPANEHADIAPRFRFVESVERVTGGDTGLAAGALVEVHLESILLTARRLVDALCDNRVAVLVGREIDEKGGVRAVRHAPQHDDVRALQHIERYVGGERSALTKRGLVAHAQL